MVGLRASYFTHRAVLAGGFCVLAFSLAVAGRSSLDWTFFCIAGGVGFAMILLAWRFPWTRLPSGAPVVIAIAADAVIALLRQSVGGPPTDYLPLTILPILWVGLNLGLLEVGIVVSSTMLTFTLPVELVGPPMYPADPARSYLLRTIVAAIVGLSAYWITGSLRAEARRADRNAALLSQLVDTQNAIATTDFELDSVLAAVVEEARVLTGAAAAAVAFPEVEGLVCRARAGNAPPLGFVFPLDSSLSGTAFATQEPVLCLDSEVDPRANPSISRDTYARAIVVVPLLHNGRAMGVLSVSSPTPGALGERDVMALSLLGSMIGTALVRAELIDKLASQAVTDDLTGLPNRRGWHEHLSLALKRAQRNDEPLSVILLDLDDFKEVNDRYGHAAGDRVLREVARRWKAALRDSDIIGRIGGDEFGVILEHAGVLAVADVVARLDRVGEPASIGVATWDGVEDGGSLVARADADMYRHKRLRSAVVA